MSVREQIEDVFNSIEEKPNFVDAVDYTDEVLDIITASIDDRIDQIRSDYGFDDEINPDYLNDVDEFEAYAQIMELEDLRDELLE
jgi:hypothetical protein